MFTKEFPYDACGHHQELLVRCWVLGDKYDVTGFQDDAMPGLLHVLDEDETTCDVIREAFESSAPGSVLRRLFAEEAIVLVQENMQGSAF